jgi:NTE family protein
MGFLNWLFRKPKPKKIKLGLALGSGGAKGFAEIGALRAFEENGIEFDIIAGTSIGSIVGAFYANGYSSNDMFELLKKLDFTELVSFPKILNMDTSIIYRTVDDAIGSLNIEELKKPYKCVATVVETGDEFVFDKGNVGMAVSASSCIPPYFKPVVIDDVRYVDGAFSNSIPADLVKQMGADYIVGIDLKDYEPKQSGILGKLFPTYKGKVEEPWAKGYEYSNVVLHPDLRGYTSISFKSGSEMYDIGYKTAIEYMPQIKEQINKLTQKRK